MAKDTFKNLKPDKKEKVIEVLKRLFQEKPFQEVTVKEIVDELGIARGSFYQYFEDLEDAYFEVLNREVVDIHKLFIDILRYQYQDLEQALEEYGKQLSVLLFDQASYLIYKNRYLYWDENLSRRWGEVHNYHSQMFASDSSGPDLGFEQIKFLKGIVHTLVKRNYKENWTKEQFGQKYQLQVSWIIKGVK